MKSTTWKNTDDTQWVKKNPLNPMVFHLIELREIPSQNEKMMLVANEIDLTDYSYDEIWEYCSGYYSSFAEMVHTYKNDVCQIIAECIFECQNISEMDYAAEINCSEAEKAVLNYMNLQK